ncbi:FadR/GntR family transcriptional regulator [Pseudomonas migulae]
MSEMNVQPVARRPHLAEHIARSLSDEIASGRLRPGDRLPTEQFLSQNFGVSRNVVREGIATLRAQGLIQSRQGVGVFVSAATQSPEPSPSARTCRCLTVTIRCATCSKCGPSWKARLPRWRRRT